MKKQVLRSSFVLGALSALMIIFVAGVSLGYYQTMHQVSNASNGSVVFNPEGIDEDLSLLKEAWNVLRDNHVDAPEYSDQEFLYAALRGLAGTFDDPNTNFFPPREAETFFENVTGSFGGIGAEIGNRDGALMIISPLKNNPAMEAGLLPGDVIVKIDGTDSLTMDVNEAVMLIRGEVGTDVLLSIGREGWSEPRDFVITRATIELPTLDHTYYDNDRILYLEIHSFNSKLVRQFSDVAGDVYRKGVRGIIVDVRNNPGGFLDVANEIAGWFVPVGDVIVSERFRSGREVRFRSSGNGALRHMPIVVLMNGGSASASEILAGALKHYNDAPLLGEQSFGKGTVQELITLSDGSSMKVTIANWVLPDGTILDREGLSPTEEIPATRPTEEGEEVNEDEDYQFERALEAIREKIRAQHE